MPILHYNLLPRSISFVDTGLPIIKFCRQKATYFFLSLFLFHRRHHYRIPPSSSIIIFLSLPISIFDLSKLFGSYRNHETSINHTYDTTHVNRSYWFEELERKKGDNN
ncbi:hypothetical protein L2E82_50776 [Cichorium intybus]|nr:hypothetical protein L2E82_50776 [Cichorium intybus]